MDIKQIVIDMGTKEWPETQAVMVYLFEHVHKAMREHRYDDLNALLKTYPFEEALDLAGVVGIIRVTYPTSAFLSEWKCARDKAWATLRRDEGDKRATRLMRGLLD